MKKDQIIELAEKWLSGTATKKEQQQLHRWYDRWEDNEEWVTDSTGSLDEIRIKIKSRIQHQLHPKPFVSFLYHYGKQIAAAAILIMMVSCYFLFIHQSEPEHPLIANDVKAPETNRAMISLANGNYVYLDSVNSGQLALQGNIKLIKLADGEIAYQTQKETKVSEAIYNTLFNPQGSRVATISLSDGTKVWLNAGSSLTYPVGFTSGERKVEIKGEAYFEVAKNEKMPFVVNINNKAEVKVLGTYFNINAYEDEATIRTTLLEGSVKVSSLVTGSSLLLAQGEQANIDIQNQLSIAKAEIEETIAWKNNEFIFNNADIETLMRQIARWYDVKVVYKNKPSKLFRGSMSRNMSIINVFRVLEETGGMKFKVEGKAVTII